MFAGAEATVVLEISAFHFRVYLLRKNINDQSDSVQRMRHGTYRCATSPVLPLDGAHARTPRSLPGATCSRLDRSRLRRGVERRGEA